MNIVGTIIASLVLIAVIALYVLDQWGRAGGDDNDTW